MVKIKEVSAKPILDSRGEETILVRIKTDIGEFSASAPNGKSKSKFEKSPYKKNLKGDIKILKQLEEYFADEVFEKFEDLKEIEDILEGHVGANTMFALEAATLKAIATQNKKEVWEIINHKAKKFPRFVGNCIGGGKHSNQDKKPTFQEFLLLPSKKSAKKNFGIMKKIKKEVELELQIKDPSFKSKKNDENAWQTGLSEYEILKILQNTEIPIGVDVAASSFFKRKRYLYENPKIVRSTEEQFEYISSLISNFGIFYVEDPFNEEDFESFSKLLKKYPSTLIVGDDLIATNHKRLKKAIEMKSINAVIVKPNQCGSLIEVKRVCEIAKANKIRIVFSHRSGETEENILADLAFGFEADFLKCGIDGKERETKIKRLIEIEKILEKSKQK